MIIDVYIKGRFRGLYKGKSAGGNLLLSRNYQHMIFTEKWLDDAEEIGFFDKCLLTKEPYHVVPFLEDIYVHWKTGEKEVFFQEKFHNIVINEIEITRNATEKTPGEMTGIFYGILKVYKPDPPKENILTKPDIDNPKVIDKKEEPNKESVVDKTLVGKEEKIDSIFTEPWQPDDFLSNYGISRQNWDGWKKRWEENWLKLALCIAGMLLMVKLGWLSAPIMWIPFLYLAKIAGDTILKIVSPNLAQRQMMASTDLVSGNRRWVRKIYFFVLLCLLFYFIAKKLVIFAFLAGILALLHLFTYGSPLLFSLRRLFHAVSLLLLLFAALRVFDNVKVKNPLPIVKDDDDGELIPEKPDSTKKENQYTISWHDYKNNLYEGKYSVPKKNFVVSYNNRVTQTPRYAIEEVYNGVFKVDKNIIDGIVAMFAQIKKDKNLDAKEFAEMSACFVQRIPYVLVHDLSCDQLIRQNPNDEFIQQYHSEGKQCLQNCKFGLQSPVEFGYNLKGDCDTRALLLFTVLDRFGYDVAIFTSQAYGHAIMGIGLPYQGLHKSYNGIKYFTWELTAKDWQPGFLAPQISNMNNWNVALLNK
jgi:hypothetical protein